jgi:hypothetical protein
MKFNLLSDFREDESGGILAFTLVMFLTMVVGGGMAIDFINHEMRREAVQDALDRGVLAATASAKAAGAVTPAEIAAAEIAARDKVLSYVTVSGFDPVALGVVVQPNFTINSQRIDVAANFNVDTYFLRLSGIQTLTGQAAAAASVQQSNIEMSLVFDVSGSMDFDVYDANGNFLGRRIDLLQAAAKDFAAIMLSGDSPNYTTISVVPFSGQVALSPTLASEYPSFGGFDPVTGTIGPWHNYSNCMIFNAADYTRTDFGPLESRQQYEHFKLFGGRGGNRPPELISWCPDSTAQIMPLSNSLTDINAMLDGLTPQGATNTWTGIKWGTALLDPSTQPIINNLTQNCPSGFCAVNPAFSSRPAAYSDPDTLKFLVVMTDGQNTSELAIPANTYNAYQSNMTYTQQNADYWDQYNAGGVLFNRNGLLPGVELTTGSEGDVRMQNICSAAKSAGIVIFTIGVDITVGSNEYDQMRNCASNTGNFYSVGSANMADAFTGISNTIQKLRLVN